MAAESLVTEVSFVQKRDALLREMQAQANLPRGGDRFVGAFCRAALRVYEESPDYMALIDSFADEEPVLNPSYRLNKLVAGHQMPMVLDDDLRERLGYPFDKEDDWWGFLHDTYGDANSEEYAALVSRLDGSLQTNRGKERAPIVAIIGAATLEHQTDLAEVNVAEYGSAAGLVGAALVSGIYQQVEVVRPDGTTNKRASRNFNAAVKNFQLGTMVGIEKNPPLGNEGIAWVKSSTNGPSKLDRISRGLEEDLFDTLVIVRGQRTDCLHEVEGDFLDPRTIQDAKRIAGSVQLVFASHVMPQSGANVPEIREATRDLQDIMPGNFRIYHEYAHKDPVNPDRLLLKRSWYGEPWACNTHVEPVTAPPSRPVHVFQWEDSYCRRVRVMPGLKDIAPRLYEALS